MFSNLRYVEQPPDGLKSSEFMDQYWFISDDGKVVVEPPTAYRAGKFKAFVWYMDENVRKRKHAKRDFIVSKEFFLAPEHYKYWSPKKLWTEHKGIAEKMKGIQSVDQVKSKSVSKGRLILYVRFLK